MHIFQIINHLSLAEKKGDNREALHDKSKKDNIMNKIKTRIF